MTISDDSLFNGWSADAMDIDVHVLYPLDMSHDQQKVLV